MSFQKIFITSTKGRYSFIMDLLYDGDLLKEIIISLNGKKHSSVLTKNKKWKEAVMEKFLALFSAQGENTRWNIMLERAYKIETINLNILKMTAENAVRDLILKISFPSSRETSFFKILFDFLYKI